MSYGNVTLVQNMLAQALTSATPDTLDELGDLMNVGNTLDSNNVTTAVINTYLADADADVNSTLSQLYRTPLVKKADMEMVLGADVLFLPAASITLPHASILTVGDELIITNGLTKDYLTVTSISGFTVSIMPSPLYQYTAAQSRVVRVRYPDPIPYVASRIAAANIYDKFFAAQSDKNESNYGKFFRNLARIKLQNIVNGITVLHGQQRIGHISSNSNLYKRYRTDGGSGDDVKLDDPGGRN